MSGDTAGSGRSVDLLVIGGGINGAGVARDAAGRGLSVMLVEKGDLAQGTSSASSKLVHGGLRYLEQYAFRLVQESLAERETLLRIAPHIVWPLTFVLPHHKHLRPVWMIRAGLFLYDILAKRARLPRSKLLRFHEDPAAWDLNARFEKGFSYADCWTQDARMVVVNAQDVARRGGTVLTRTAVRSAVRKGAGWTIALQEEGGTHTTVHARALVNAGGPWAGSVITGVTGQNKAPPLRLVKGSHIVVPKHFPGDHAYTFQTADGRVVFAIPYEENFTLIGTTEEDFTADPGTAAISENEVRYLCDVISSYSTKPLSPADVVWTYAGVRPLVADGVESASKTTREYKLALEDEDGAAPVVHILGGKLTTYRTLATKVVDKLAPYFPTVRSAWTHTESLPGGDLPNGDHGAFARDLATRHPWMPRPILDRWVRHYGSDTPKLLEGRQSLVDLGQDFGGALYEAEVSYLRDHEWAHTAQDVLWRRTKAGLRLTPAEREALAAWMG